MSHGRRIQHSQRHRLEKYNDMSSSSSLAEDVAENDARPRSISASSSGNNENVKLRRRKRKRKSSSANSTESKQSWMKQKLFNIERALLNLDSSNDGERSEETENRDLNQGRKALKELAISDGGLVNDDARKKVWPRLLNIDMVETSVSITDEEVKANKNYHQVLMDVNRSLKRFPPGIADDDRPELQDQLTRLIIRILDKHPQLHYYQGYHDVAITFLLVVGEEMAFNILEKLSTGPWLREFMNPTMEKTTYLLNYMYPLIEQVDAELYGFLEESEVGTIFALPWLITWFGHVLPDYNDVVRLYDFFLAQPPMMAIYLATSIVLHKSDQLKQVECDMAMVHAKLSKIPLESPPFELLLRQASQLYRKFPPETIEADVESRMEKLKAALTAPKPLSKVVSRTTPPPTSFGPVTFFRKMAFVAAPVLIGVFLYRYMQNNHVF